MKLILGICGVAGSGKTTLAMLLRNCGWQRTRFSEDLKAMLSVLLTRQGVDFITVDRMLDGDLKETPTEFLSGRTPRYAMQTLGTEWRETIDRDLWVDAWKRRVQASTNTKILADDLRFHHEAAAVRELGGKIIRIKRGLASPTGSHISEIESWTLSVDGEITNDGTPDAMLTQLATIMEYWK